MKPDMAPFDVFACPLAGTTLIEASAGTGKTWNICALYMRLVLERDLQVDQILVVTFTNAATAELRERLRNRLRETLDHVRGQGPAAQDAFVAKLVSHAEAAGVDTQQMSDRLELALRSFDEAAIFTIHGFCQRALAEAAFAAGAAFEVEVVPKDDVALEVAQDFWRRRVADRECHPVLAAYLAHESKDSPAKLAKLLQARLARPLARLRWPDDLMAPAMLDTRALEGAHAAAAASWQASRHDIETTLLGATDRLHASHSSRPALVRALAGWDMYFGAGDPVASLDVKDVRLDLCRASVLAKNTHKGKVAPRHEFCTLLDPLFEARAALDRELRRARLRLVHELLEWGPAEARERKRLRRVVGYDDLIWNLHQALHAGDAAPMLAEALRTRFPAALIDEFQDTDPVQLGIFRAIYAGSTLPLFLVGDPKQAIYSFRNADLHTYLEARSLAAARYTLVENQRSSGDLIASANTLFGRNERAFILEDLAYHAVTPGGSPRAVLDDRSRAVRDLCVWLLPSESNGPALLLQEAKDAAIAATTAEISRLLREARDGRITFGGRPLQAGDIAVLVRSHAQGTLIREALRMVGIGSVELAQSSVFRTSDAAEIERVLLAALEPTRPGYVRSALATEMLGLDATAIEALAADDSALVAHMEAFARYHDLWITSRQGVGAMLRTLFVEHGVVTRMLARGDGERRLTNLLHLAERLHEASSRHEAPDALLRWLHGQRVDPGDEDAAQLRLESDRDLVQIVTVHKSKGLQYPVVFCPFLWTAHRSRARDDLGTCTYHDDDGSVVVDFRNDAEQGAARADIGARILAESLAETVRLMYVAITRASHRCYVVGGCYARGTKGQAASESMRNMLNWLVAGVHAAPEQWCDAKLAIEAVGKGWAEFTRVVDGHADVLPVPTDAPAPYDDPAADTDMLPALEMRRTLARGFRISSYSGLSYDLVHEAEPADASTPAIPTRPQDAALATVAADDILEFPRGALAGECLHAALERCDFDDEATWDGAIERALAASPFRGERARAERYRAMIRNMIGDVVATPLVNGLRLADVSRSRRLTELEFSLPAPELRASALNALLQRHGYAVPTLGFADLHGFLKGYIDAVVEHGGRYYIVDWKSNHLGYGPDDYARERLDAAMAERGYHLQHLVYSIALHRLLGRRLSRYRFEAHFGGVLYLFIRGVRPHWRAADGTPRGVWHQVPALTTLAELDALLLACAPVTA